MQDVHQHTSVHCEYVIYCANRIPDCLSESCVTEIQPNPALNSQGPFPSHATGTQLWSQDFGSLGASCSSTGSGFSVQRGAVALPRAHGAAAHSSQLPSLHISLPSWGSGVPFSTQPWPDTDGFWALTAPAVRAADNTPSYRHGYQQSADTFRRVNMGKMQGLQSCWKLASLELHNSTKSSAKKKNHSRLFTKSVAMCSAVLVTDVKHSSAPEE